MKVVSINQVVELNGLLKERELLFKIHLRDACGAQSFYIEPLEDIKDKSKYDELYDAMELYFNKNNMDIVFTEDKIHFTIK